MQVGRLGRPHGLEGFIGLYVETEDLVYFETGSRVLIDDLPYTVSAVRPGKKGYQVMFEEAPTRDQAEELRGYDVLASRRRALTENEYWPADLVGLHVRPGGGQVVAVDHGAAQDRLVIDRHGERFEVPFVGELVPVVDLEGGFVEIVEIEGLSPRPGPP